MKKHTSIQINAAFLLFVFTLNTIVGFACAFGAKVNLNEASISVNQQDLQKPHIHADGHKHNHQHAATVPQKNLDKKKKGNCCKDEVQKIQSLDKAITQNAKVALVPIFFSSINSFLNSINFPSSNQAIQKFSIRFFYPPPPDIRIAIQSFQI
ncbi:MAG: hypothetical protein H7178_10875 [Chitinophagaceae bacterium]|nr:hypothetical protein [Chitinophagaceae bacterium]